MIKKNEIGRIGEDMACQYIKKMGWYILVRNYKRRFGEIDIIARDLDATLIFIEVKTLLIRSAGGLKSEDNFTTQKYNKVNRTCVYFVNKYPGLIDENKGWRIDLIAIELYEDDTFNIKHYENV